MEKLITYVNAAIQNLDQLNVQGARNMSIVVETIKILDMLKQNLPKPEVKTNEQDHPE